jgi:hypothetical protein
VTAVAQSITNYSQDTKVQTQTHARTHTHTHTHTVVTKTSGPPSTVQFTYRATSDVRKWGKTKLKLAAGFEASTCIVALRVIGK